MLRATSLLVLFVLFLSPSLEARRRAVGRGTDHRNLTTAQWLKAYAVPFATNQPESGFDDLAALHRIVGDARIVSLGEATHGSNEFFAMKHRMLEYLAETMGFTVFGIEAALPETDAVNDYVVHGVGDPARAVAGMGFWTWNVQEVLDMVHWMRAYNLRRRDKPPLQFRGFDMQTSQYGLARLNEYLTRIDPSRRAATMSMTTCWEPYAVNSTEYPTRPANEQTICAASLAQLYQTLASRRAEYIALSSAEQFEVMLRYSRVFMQDESIAARRGSRDSYMAENVEWLANVLAPGEKLVLWAHNFHVAAASPVMMGNTLRRRFPGREMVIFGFFFDRGDFNARHDGRLKANRVERFDGGYEQTLRGVGHARMFVDLRNIVSDQARGYFASPSSHWMIGALFDSVNVTNNRMTGVSSSMYDVIIWFDEVKESKLLPF